jgi:protein-S-isoprenylcysteine O-methyltransferase Ste14
MNLYSGLISVCWALFLVAWAVGAVYNAVRGPKTANDAPRLDVIPRWTLALVALIVVGRLLPMTGDILGAVAFRNSDVARIGAALLMASTAFALWARWTLGRMWSSVPTVKEHHELRTDGPYRITRHPIYTGIIGMLLGTAMVAGFGVTWLGVIVFASIFLYRIPREERLMTETFGEQYVRYQHEVPRIVPLVHI